MIKGITVDLFNPREVGRDELGIPVTIDEPPEAVPNVLVYPASPEAVVTDLQLFGKRTVYELCIPKVDQHEWEDRKVRFFGKTFRTFGPCIEYIDANVPLKWNRKIRVERYE